MKKSRRKTHVPHLSWGIVATVILGVAAVIVGAVTLMDVRNPDPSTPDEMFWAAVESGLSARGYVSVSDNSADGTTRRTTTRASFEQEPVVEVRTEFDDQAIDSIIRTVSTKTRDYLYYERNNNTTNPSYKKLEGTWVDIGLAGQQESKSYADTLSNGTLLLIGGLSSKDAAVLVQDARSRAVYEVVDSRQVDGSWVLSVEVNVQQYNAYLARYLSLNGLTVAASQIDIGGVPDDAVAPTVEVRVDSATGNFTGYGLPVLNAVNSREFVSWEVQQIEVPTQYISPQDLEQLLMGL